MAKNITIIGGGPGGYTAAIRAAQLGAGVVLVEEKQLGGTCLNLGCIPTKVYYKHAQLLEGLLKAGDFGIKIEFCSLDYAKMQSRKTAVVEQLRDGIHKLLKANGVVTVFGKAVFEESGVLRIIESNGNITRQEAENIIIATGSSPILLSVPGSELPGVITSDEILSLEKLPSSFVVIGGGVIGIEWAGIFNALGSRVTVLEYMPNILPNFETDLSKRLIAGLKRKGIQIETGMTVKEIIQGEEGLQVLAAGKKGEDIYQGEMVFLSTGRTINVKGLNLDGIGVLYDRKGIKVDSRYQTTVPGIYAVGDVIGGLMLAHVAAKEGAAAVEGIMGQDGHVDYDSVPSCVFTFPETAVVGLTEDQAKEAGLLYVTSKFMFGANGKALTMGEGEGFVKVISEQGSHRLLGAHIMGPHASDLIHEPALAIANKLTVRDIIRTVHAHPTLGETFSEAVLGLENRAIHMLPKK